MRASCPRLVYLIIQKSKVRSNPCSAGILPATGVPHNSKVKSQKLEVRNNSVTEFEDVQHISGK
ncbi:MAG: hypothetical protein F6K54_09740 [Okeania sp. SIO3B5]|uniref:hypothetical protein n=1 Tax=Okeania sp. SIO3B5 TaxID=2607811 RepID=UPI0013FEB9BE|nr:hypothetical protein [Okeania sp. SIO3B5]NEO53335.1 hypothetical protein [Okeania sp. SIO3B5]